MDLADLIAFWNRCSPESPPVGWLLREALRSRWLRVHSLPESKRYAGTTAECDELLRRHNEVASEILGSGVCALAVSAWSDDPNRIDWTEQIQGALPNLNFVHAWSWDGDDVPLQTGIARVEWCAGGLDALIRAVADDRTGPVALFSPATGEVYAPYDGGADLIVSTEDRKAQLRKRWQAWLSDRPDGL